MNKLTKKILIILGIVFMASMVIPISVGAVTNTDALSGLASIITGILDAQKQTGKDLLSAYELYLDALTP